MAFAISRGVPEAGVAFAATTMIGVALVLRAALAVVLFGQQLLRPLVTGAIAVDTVTRAIQVVAGLVLVVVAVDTMLR